ncbi:MAG: VTT domain-containing protein [Bryobacteraceae bacterium]
MLAALLDFLKSLTDPQRLIHLLSTVFTGWWGYLLLCGIVFSETGLLVGFFLPGDSLLFTVGVVTGAGRLSIFAIIPALTLAALCGNGMGYTLGRFVGVELFRNPDSRLFRREHLERTQHFYDRHGGKILIYAQFMPIVRTYAAFVAGVARMGYGRFFSFNVIGSIGWVFTMTLLGYTLGGIPLVRAHFEKVVILIILISLMPVFLEVVKHRLRARQGPAAGD